MKKKKWQGYIMVSVGLCMLPHVSTVAAEPVASAVEMQAEAVTLARNGDYKTSLQILDKLEMQGYRDEGFWADYITILSWAGEDAKMIREAEKHYVNGFGNMPDYAAMPLAQAYIRQGKADRADEILSLLSKRGNVEAELIYAERMLYLGEYDQADKLYQEIASQKDVPPYRVHYSKALASMQRNDFVSAEKEFALAAKLVPQDQKEIVRDMDAKKAALYIQHREEDRAVNVLRPYVENHTATMHMLSDYLTALRYDEKPDEAIAVFKRECPDWSKVPSYGLQNMADLYLRAERYREADKIYRYILTRDDIAYVRMGHAYCLAAMRQDRAAIEEYAAIVERYPDLQSAVAVDGTTMLRMGRISLARHLYALLGKTKEEKASYQLQYAQTLMKLEPEDDKNEGLNFKQTEKLDGRTYYHEAQRNFSALKDDPVLGLAAKSGMAENKVKKGLYADADAILQQVSSKDETNANLFSPKLENDMRPESSLHTYFENGMDYKKDHSIEFGMDFQKYIGGNFYKTDSVSHHVLHDDESDASYNQMRSGVSYHFDRGQFDLTYDRYSGGDYSSSNGLRSLVTYEFNDLAQITFETGKRPHETATAVSAGIHERFKTLQWAQIVNDRTRFTFGYNWNTLSDGNHYSGYDAATTYNLTTTPGHRDNLLFTYGHGHYDSESLSYDSPKRRVDYAAGFSRKWLIPRRERTIESITMLSWGHDNDEAKEFAPSTRIELTQNLPGNQSIVIGGEYSWHQNRATDETNRRSSGYLFDINYYLEW